MKLALLAMVGLLVLPLQAEAERPYVIVPCGKDNAVLYSGSESPDKHYALGWTILPVAKDAPAVDWIRLEKEGQDYVDPLVQERNPSHKIAIGLIDQQAKSFKFITDTFPPMVAHWDDRIEVRWTDQRHAFAQNRAKWGPHTMFFISADNGSLQVTLPHREMNQRVKELLEQKRPLAPSLVISYSLRDPIDSAPNSKPCKIEDGFLHVAFYAYRPRGVEYEDLRGHVLISLKDGKPLKAVSSQAADKPFVGELGEANQQLNVIYGRLRKLLSGDALTKLKAEQQAWIGERNEFAHRKAPGIADEGMLEDYRRIRNQEALRLTRERIEVLNQALASMDREHR